MVLLLVKQKNYVIMSMGRFSLPVEGQKFPPHLTYYYEMLLLSGLACHSVRQLDMTCHSSLTDLLVGKFSICWHDEAERYASCKIVESIIWVFKKRLIRLKAL